MADPLHTPAPNGLPGGYPVSVNNGDVSVALPQEWTQSETVELMKQAHQRDGIEKIGDDGSIHFLSESVAILQDEMDIHLPEVIKPGDIESVANDQIKQAQKVIQKH